MVEEYLHWMVPDFTVHCCAIPASQLRWGEWPRQDHHADLFWDYCGPNGIEIPEQGTLHLHPQGQAKMGELLGLCTADGVQILVETHNDHVLKGIRLAVKNGSLKADDVRLCYFTPLKNVKVGSHCAGSRADGT